MLGIPERRALGSVLALQGLTRLRLLRPTAVAILRVSLLLKTLRLQLQGLPTTLGILN